MTDVGEVPEDERIKIKRWKMEKWNRTREKQARQQEKEEKKVEKHLVNVVKNMQKIQKIIQHSMLRREKKRERDKKMEEYRKKEEDKKEEDKQEEKEDKSKKEKDNRKKEGDKRKEEDKRKKEEEDKQVQGNNNEKSIYLSKHDLPIKCRLRYLGEKRIRGFWGLHNTRKAIDELVDTTKHFQAYIWVNMEISKRSLTFKRLVSTGSYNNHKHFKEQTFDVDSITYGVQDKVYNKVFSIIVIADNDEEHGICHAFLCESTYQARLLTTALAKIFTIYCRMLRKVFKDEPHVLQVSKQKKKNNEGVEEDEWEYAIDLKSPEDVENAWSSETEA